MNDSGKDLIIVVKNETYKEGKLDQANCNISLFNTDITAVGILCSFLFRSIRRSANWKVENHKIK